MSLTGRAAHNLPRDTLAPSAHGYLSPSLSWLPLPFKKGSLHGLQVGLSLTTNPHALTPDLKASFVPYPRENYPVVDTNAYSAWGKRYIQPHLVLFALQILLFLQIEGLWQRCVVR